MELRALFRGLIIGAAVSLLSLSSHAQQIPSAGSLLREMQEPPPVPKGPSATIERPPEPKPAIRKAPGLKIEVKAFRLYGLTVLDEEELLPALEDYLGPDRDFLDLQAAAQAVTEYLREAGYFLAHAYVPAQRVQDGVIEIAVLEGRIGRVKVVRGCELRLEVPSGGNTEEGMIGKFETEFASKKQECAVLIVRATSDPEKWTIAGFGDAGEFRTVDPSHELSEELKKRPRNESKILKLATKSLGRTFEDSIPVSESIVSSVLSVLPPGTVIRENSIERALYLVGDLRGISVRSVVKPGKDVGTADIVVYLSPGRRVEATVEADNFGTRFTGEYRVGGRVEWNSPLRRGDSLMARVLVSLEGDLAFGRLSYLTPVGPHGTKLGAAYSTLRYDLGTSTFEDLDVDGKAEVISAYALHPFIRGRNVNLFGSIGYDHRRLEDDFAAAKLRNRRDLDVFITSLVGDNRDRLFGGGINTFSVTYTGGEVDIKDPQWKQIDTSTGLKIDGVYHKWNLSVTRLQRLTGTFLGYLDLRGQWASTNLDSSEKMSLGGPGAVRAYAEGEAASDDAVLFTAELRFPIRAARRAGLPGDLNASLFVDTGHGKINKNSLVTDEDNTRTRTGAGFGLTWGRPKDFLVQATVAWRLTGRPVGDRQDRVPRAFVQMSKSF